MKTAKTVFGAPTPSWPAVSAAPTPDTPVPSAPFPVLLSKQNLLLSGRNWKPNYTADYDIIGQR